jgi:hypothetical protein
MRMLGKQVLFLIWVALLAVQLLIANLDGGHRVADVVIVVAGVIVGAGMGLMFEWPILAGLVVGATLSWAGVSTLRSAKLSADSPKLTARPVAPAPAGDATPPLRIGLALSGGGYRAALLHAGVLSGLERLQVPVTNLSTVSGGSIIGSYYAAGGTPRAFAQTVLEKRSMNLKRDVLLAQNVWGLVRPSVGFAPYSDSAWGSLDRIDLQASALDAHLLGGGGLTLQGLSNARPRLLICTTDLRTGALVGLTPAGMVMRSAPRPDRADEDVFVPWPAGIVGRPLPLSLAAAISGAFPGAFPSRRFVVPAGEGKYVLGLADGGVADNSGVLLMMAADRLAWTQPREAPPKDTLEGHLLAQVGGQRSLDASWQLDLILASDGGMPLMPFGEGGVLGGFFRAMDVVHAMSQASKKDAGGRPFVTFNPRSFLLALAPRATKNTHADAEALGTGVSFDPTTLDRRAVELLADIAHPDRKATMQAAARDFLANDLDEALAPALRARLVTTDGKTSWLRTLADARAAVKAAPEMADSTRRLIETIHADLQQSLEVFQRTSTLEDQMSPEDGWALYRLGEYLVLLQAKALREAVAKAQANKANPVSALQAVVPPRKVEIGIEVPPPRAAR